MITLIYWERVITAFGRRTNENIRPSGRQAMPTPPKIWRMQHAKNLSEEIENGVHIYLKDKKITKPMKQIMLTPETMLVTTPNKCASPST